VVFLDGFGEVGYLPYLTSEMLLVEELRKFVVHPSVPRGSGNSTRGLEGDLLYSLAAVDWGFQSFPRSFHCFDVRRIRQGFSIRMA
jgi:hypothetical protein